ncbi:unnamed protein product [Lupinus luteus]|uniref:Uncharacterized protein n=1 Tax=Lupinus luteus TaxID=3873 RepID=A0AAV1YD78_LUPLU
MGFFRKIAGFLGLSKDQIHEEDDREGGQPRTTPYRVIENGIPRKGFSVPAQVVIDRPHLGPILTPSNSGDGGVQGLGWYVKRLRIDEDGDLADEFLDSSETSTLYVHHLKTETGFKHKGVTRPAKVKQQVLSDGKLMHCVEHRGRLQLV